MTGSWRAWAALLVLVHAAACEAVCGQGASCRGNVREDCVDLGELWGGNKLVVTNCRNFTCVDLGNDAMCVLGPGKDPACPPDGTHDLCDGNTYYRCVFGYRAAQKDCGSSTCTPGNRGCGLHACPDRSCMQEALGCQDTGSRYVCQGNEVLWECTEDKLVFRQDCGYQGLGCNAELGECAWP